MATIPKQQQDTPLTKDESNAILKRVVSENLPLYRKQYFIAFLLLLIVSASTMFTAYVIEPITDEVFAKKNLTLAYYIAIAIFLVFTARGFASYGYMYTLGKVGNNIVARYQRRIFDHLLKLGVNFHKSNRSSYLVGQINQNIIGMRTMLNDTIIVLARDVLTLVFLVSLMIYQDWFMSLVSLTILPILAYIMSRYAKRMKRAARQEVDLNARVTSTIMEASQGIEIVKAFTMEGQMAAKLNNITAEAEKRSNRIVQLNAKTKPPPEILAGFAVAGVVAYGGYQVAELGQPLGNMLSFITAAMLAYEPAKKLASFRVSFEKTLVNARMLYEILDTPERQADKQDAKALRIDKGQIKFQKVSFTYDGNKSTLKDICITAKTGKTTALVGPSGGGKSTLVALTQRFFDLDDGAILIDDQDIKHVTAKSLRQNIAYVSQQPILFEGSILENIRYGRPHATDDEVIAAANLAQAHQFILDQPAGYDTLVGEMGGNLSGGQRQRLSIARAFLRDAPILLLDEATSALDNESELLVQQALDKLVKGRTTIVVAHRLSTIRNADRIYVIENGSVTQEGTHASLIKKKTGTYAKLHGIGTMAVAKKSTTAKKTAVKKPRIKKLAK